MTEQCQPHVVTCASQWREDQPRPSVQCCSPSDRLQPHTLGFRLEHGQRTGHPASPTLQEPPNDLA